jgi:iron only hydrogenase large subunit-like protein
MGMSTGAAVIFGLTGGVMEAALRTVYEVVSGETLETVDFCEVRGLEGIKEAVVNIPKLGDVKVAIAHGLSNAADLLDRIKAGEAEYHFIEIMGCPGGCIGGGGQPLVSSSQRLALEESYLSLRSKAIYSEDCSKTIRKSHENPAIKEVYEKYLGEPLGEKSHHLLHTKYTVRPKYQVEIPAQPTK